jgi:hypothetical protein
MTRDLIIRRALDKVGQAMFEGRRAMLVPLSEGECGELGKTVIAAHETFGKLARHLATLEGIGERLAHVENAFGFLARLHQDRNYEGHLGFEALNVLCARAVKAENDTRDLVLEKLVESLRRAGKVEVVA